MEANKIIFIHGMFQNPKSWEHWMDYFQGNGYECEAPAWPYHEGEPAKLRNNLPAGLGDLRLKTVIDQYAAIAQACDTPPVLIGHSVGGLIAQVLVSRQLAKAAVCISSVAPNKMFAFDWGFFKNSLAITNPLKGDDPYIMTPEGFHASFANTMSRDASDIAYQQYATHDSRYMLRDCLTEDGEIDIELPHAPLLFISGEKDEIIPPALNEKNCKAYKDENSRTEFIEFPGRGHFICGEQRWQEIATYANDWLDKLKLEPVTLSHNVMG
jgi:pimeloyl-ACP methyl ester carboxylesterase